LFIIFMAFIRKKTKVFPWNVTILSPSETKPSVMEEQQFVVKFKRLGRKELTAFDELPEDLALETIVKGWEGFTEEDGTEIPFNKKNLHDLADDVDFVTGVISAYKEFYSGGAAKN